MSNATKKPDPHVINNLHKITGKPLDECAAVFVANDCQFRAALNDLQKSTPLKHIPVPEQPIPATFDGTLTNGNVIKPGMTLEEIDAAVPARATGKPTIDKCRRVMRKVMQEQRTAEQWAAFRRMTGATTFEYEGVEA